MTITEILFFGLVLWTAIGGAGTTLRALRGDVRGARKGAFSIALVWAVYLAVLLGVSLTQAQREIAVGRDQCFDKMCFAVEGVDELQGFEARGQERARLLRVKVRVANRGKEKTESESSIRAYLLDGEGRRWEEVRGLEGVRLTTRIAAGDTVVSEPVFRVSKEATGLSLVLTHGRWQPGVLVIGDPDSWRHRPTLMRLQP